MYKTKDPSFRRTIFTGMYNPKYVLEQANDSSWKKLWGAMKVARFLAGMYRSRKGDCEWGKDPDISTLNLRHW